MICTQDDILLEVQIQNATPTHMFLDTVTFDPTAGFRAQDLNTIRSKELAKKSNPQKYVKFTILSSSEVSVFGKDNLLPPRNIRQHLYKLTPLTPLQTSGIVSFFKIMKSLYFEVFCILDDVIGGGCGATGE